MSAVTQLVPRSDGPGHPLTFRQLAAVLGVSRPTVYRLWRDGRFPVIKTRAAHRVNGHFSADLLAALAERRDLVFEDFSAEWMAANPGEAAS